MANARACHKYAKNRNSFFSWVVIPESLKTRCCHLSAFAGYSWDFQRAEKWPSMPFLFVTLEIRSLFPACPSGRQRVREAAPALGRPRTGWHLECRLGALPVSHECTTSPTVQLHQEYVQRSLYRIALQFILLEGISWFLCLNE